MRFLCIFLVFILHLPHVFWSCYPLTYIVLIIGDIYICVDVCYSPIFPFVVYFPSLYICFLYNVCNLIFLFHTKIP